VLGFGSVSGLYDFAVIIGLLLEPINVQIMIIIMVNRDTRVLAVLGILRADDEYTKTTTTNSNNNNK